MKQKALPLAIASAFLGVVFDWFFVGKIPGVSVFLYACLILGFTFYCAHQIKVPSARFERLSTD